MTGLFLLVFVALFVVIIDTRQRMKRLEDRVWNLDAQLHRQAGAELERSVPIVPQPAQPEPVDFEDEPLSADDLAELPKGLPLEAMPWPAPAEPSIRSEPEPEAVPEEPETRAEPEPDFKAEAEPVEQSAAYEEETRRGFAVNFEDLFGRRLPIWAGGITLAIAGVLIVRYAIDIGLFQRVFTPAVQSVSGMLFGLALIGGAEWAWARRERVADPRVSQALSGAGISTLYASLLVASQVYHLISPLTAFLGVAVVTAGALFLSLRHGAPSALLGLAGGLTAPAQTAGVAQNVPLLSVYLALTIAGLVGVSRMQRWPWLALIALTAGAGWSLWLVLASRAFDTLASLSLGGLILLLALGLPAFSLEGLPRQILRAMSALVGAVQLAVLVAIGGFEPLHWGLFALIAVAGQWLAWRDEAFAIVPTIGAALSFLLLMLWPDPDGTWLAGMGAVLTAIHAGPLLTRLWRQPVRLQPTIELAAIAVAVPFVTLRHGGLGWDLSDTQGGWSTLAGAALALLTAALGWKDAERWKDSRFALLVATGSALLLFTAHFALPDGIEPLAQAVVALGVLFLARPAGDDRLHPIAGALGIVAMTRLLATAPYAELNAFAEGIADPFDLVAPLRWFGLAAMAGLIAWRASARSQRDVFGLAAGWLGYGAMAQILPEVLLPIAPAAGLLALAAWARRIAPRDLGAAMIALASVAVLWAFEPLIIWTMKGGLSLFGVAMKIDGDSLDALFLLRRLLTPALLAGGALAILRQRLSGRARVVWLALVAVPLGIAVHCYYRIAFAGLFGTDFALTGLPERLIWCALLVGFGWLLARRTSGPLAERLAPALVAAAALHLFWYSLVLHNPLWADQAVGPVPLANLLLPLFAALPLCLELFARIAPQRASLAGRLRQPVLMAMVALFTWASLRQAFHGSLLAEPGLGSVEDILRSILGIALAIGYLLWGIRTKRRDWRLASLVLMLAAVGKVFLFDASGLEGLLRIASFVALGFSLIGIGWIYARQLRREEVGS